MTPKAARDDANQQPELACTDDDGDENDVAQPSKTLAVLSRTTPSIAEGMPGFVRCLHFPILRSVCATSSLKDTRL